MTSEVKDAKPEENKANKSGIPKAVFVEDVHVYMQQAENESAEVVLRRLDEQHQKYKFMEQNLNLKKKRLKVQLPELKGALNAIMHLEEKDSETIDTQFMLADNLYVKAKIPPTKKVGLWLGANVMLEYTLEEARTLLQKNITQAKEASDVVDEDLGFLRDQTTTTEVSMARVYNWNVKRRLETKKLASSGESGEASV